MLTLACTKTNFKNINHQTTSPERSKYIYVDIHTYISYIQSYMHTCVQTCMQAHHTYIHTDYTYLQIIRVCMDTCIFTYLKTIFGMYKTISCKQTQILEHIHVHIHEHIHVHIHVPDLLSYI